MAGPQVIGDGGPKIIGQTGRAPSSPTTCCRPSLLLRMHGKRLRVRLRQGILGRYQEPPTGGALANITPMLDEAVNKFAPGYSPRQAAEAALVAVPSGRGLMALSRGATAPVPKGALGRIQADPGNDGSARARFNAWTTPYVDREGPLAGLCVAFGTSWMLI